MDNEIILDIACAKTGVFTIWKVHNIFDMLNYESINVDFEARQIELEKEYHTNLITEHNLSEDYDFENDPDEVTDDYALENQNEFYAEDTQLIGFIKDDEGNYIDDVNAEFSCVFGETYAQVVRSRYIC